MATPLVPELLPPPPPPSRRPVLLVGAALAVAAGVMVFAGLLGSYFSAQDAGDAWPPEEATLANVAILVTYVTLVFSSVTAQWSVAAITAGDRTAMYLAIGVTLLLGLAFLNGLTFVWGQLGVGVGDGPFSTTVYAVTGAHALAVGAAIVTFLVMGFRALGGQFGPGNREFVQVAAMVWHAAVAVGAVIWFFVWFMEGMPRS